MPKKMIPVAVAAAALWACPCATAAAELWTIKGKVVDEAGTGMAKLMISAYDLDLGTHDFLGGTTTKKNGEFTIIYTEQEFDEEFPDIYVVVTARGGDTLYSSEDQIRMNAGQKEHFDIVIKAASEPPLPEPAGE